MKGCNFLEEEENSDSNERKGRGVGDLREGEFEELDAAVGTIVRFPVLGMES